MNKAKEELINQEVKIKVINSSVTTKCLENLNVQNLVLLLEIQSDVSNVKNIRVQITSESDPMVLLSTVITENDYQNLKELQGLYDDFNSFPRHFADLIKKCIEEQYHESSNRFILVLRTSTNDLKCNEATPGRVSLEIVDDQNWRRLSVPLTPASLKEKLCHLSSCINYIKSNALSERECYSKENSDLKNKVQQYEKKIESLKKDFDSKVSVEKQKHLKGLSDSDRKFAREKREIESKFGEKFTELKNELTELKKENLTLKSKNSELNSNYNRIDDAFRDTKHKLKESESKCERYFVELREMSKEREDLKNKFHLSQDTIIKCENQISHQEKMLQEREQMSKALDNKLKNALQTKTNSEDRVEKLEEKVEKREEGIRRLYSEFYKSLDVIAKVKQKLKEVQLKNDSLTKSLNSYEKELKENETTIKDLKEDNEKYIKELPVKDREIEDLNIKLQASLNEIKEKEEQFKSNANVMDHLNKRLNELESAEAIAKRAPLAEVYMLGSQGRGKGLSPIINTSTPINAQNLLAKNFITSAQSKGHSMSSVLPTNEKLMREENEDNFNIPGLEEKYVEATSQRVPLHGLLRANAVNANQNTKQNEINSKNNEIRPKQYEINSKNKEVIAKHGEQPTGPYFRTVFNPGGEKSAPGGVKPSAYFAKR